MGFNCPAHIFYSYRFSVVKIVTNGLGIIRHLDFYNKDFLAKHPELEPNKKSDSPDEDKSIHDARLLIPTLMDFFKAHPLINPKTFLDDAAFDSIDIYKTLLIYIRIISFIIQIITSAPSWESSTYITVRINVIKFIFIY